MGQQAASGTTLQTTAIIHHRQTTSFVFMSMIFRGYDQLHSEIVVQVAIEIGLIAYNLKR